MEYLRLTGAKSHPVRGAWIEMPSRVARASHSVTSHPVRGAWIEISTSSGIMRFFRSHPVRGAWIEIQEYSIVITHMPSRIP